MGGSSCKHSRRNTLHQRSSYQDEFSKHHIIQEQCLDCLELVLVDYTVEIWGQACASDSTGLLIDPHLCTHPYFTVDESTTDVLKQSLPLGILMNMAQSPCGAPTTIHLLTAQASCLRCLSTFSVVADYHDEDWAGVHADTPRQLMPPLSWRPKPAVDSPKKTRKHLSSPPPPHHHCNYKAL